MWWLLFLPVVSGLEITTYLYGHTLEDVYCDPVSEPMSLYIPQGVTTIKHISDCNIVYVYFQPSVEVIGNQVFKDTNIISADLASTNLKTIGEGAFSDCKSLETVTFPDTLETIGQQAFYGCISLKTVTFPAGVDIKQQAFESCTNLKTVTFSAGVKIGSYAFSSLEEATFLGDIPNQWDDSFGSLKHAYFADDISQADRNAVCGDGCEQHDIPDECTSLSKKYAEECCS